MVHPQSPKQPAQTPRSLKHALVTLFICQETNISKHWCILLEVSLLFLYKQIAVLTVHCTLLLNRLRISGSFSSLFLDPLAEFAG